MPTNTPSRFAIACVVGIYLALNAYLLLRFHQGLEGLGSERGWITLGFSMMSVLGIGVQVAPFWGARGRLFGWLHTTGSVWMAVMLYGLLAVAVMDLGRLTIWISGANPPFLESSAGRAMLTAGAAGVVGLLTLWGSLRAYRPRITPVEIRLEKSVPGVSGLRIALLSDLHLGHTNGKRFLKRVLRKVEAQRPDLILLAGDTFDGGPDPVLRYDKGAPFRELKSTYGTFAVTGNHEYIGRMEQPDAVEAGVGYLARQSVKTLQDEAGEIAGGIFLVGRCDREERGRKSVEELLSGLDPSRPVILLDHQPYELERAEAAGVDLMLSGHTHHGQLWPLGGITRRLFEQDWGYLRRGASHFYVCCGTGTWGPPVRTSGYAEIAIISLTFKE